MNSEQMHRARSGKGFIAALDQSGGSTPKALKLYGVEETSYSSEDEMFDLEKSKIRSLPVVGEYGYGWKTRREIG